MGGCVPSELGVEETEEEDLEQTPRARRDLNLWAVFIHSLGDALSSLLVCISGMGIHYFDRHQDMGGDHTSCADINDCMWTDYIDPVCSLVLVAFIAYTVLPVVKDAMHILIQGCPAHIDLPALEREIAQLPGVQGVRELHVWQLDGSGLVVASAQLGAMPDAENVLEGVKVLFHSYGIHSSTIQLEVAPSEQLVAKEWVGLCQVGCESTDKCCVEP